MGGDGRRAGGRGRRCQHAGCPSPPVGAHSRGCSAPAAGASCAPSSARGAVRAFPTRPTRGSSCPGRAAGTASWRTARSATAAPARSGPRSRPLATRDWRPTLPFPNAPPRSGVRHPYRPVPTSPFRLQECTDACCFAHNCSLRAGAQCTHGDCCARCLVRAWEARGEGLGGACEPACWSWLIGALGSPGGCRLYSSRGLPGPPASALRSPSGSHGLLSLCASANLPLPA